MLTKQVGRSRAGLAARGRRRHPALVKIGPYEVLGVLGRGAMGIVYEVRAPDGREAALKLLLRGDRAALARFERERRLLASLGEEEGFVGVLDSGSAAEGAWLVMPLVPGGTLRKRLEAGPLGVEETIVLGVRLANALGKAHERGIVHRDVKPENVLFTASGRPLLADLGLAKHFDRSASGASRSVSLSAHGEVRGTAGYMAPEQLADAAGVGPAADVFALGAVLHECLAGRPAFAGADMVELLAKLSSGTVEPIGRPGVPAWLEEVVRRALAADPRARFADGAALARALGARKASRTAASRRRRVLAALVPGVLLGAAVLAAAFVPGRPAPAAPAPIARELVKKETPPVEPGPVSLSPRALVEQAGEKVGRDDVEGAIADCSRAIELDPGLAQAWAQRGAVRYRKGDWDGAIADATRAIELDPGLAEVWANRGSARANKDADWAGVLSDSSKAIELDPGLARAWDNRAFARSSTGDVEGAIADATRAIELDPKLANAWQHRGAALLTRGDSEGAIADETKAIELAPGLASAWGNRAGARLNRGDTRGAIDDVTKAIELDSGSATTWFIRGLARCREGDLAAGSSDLERSLELEPSGPDANNARQALEEARRRTR